MADPSDDNTHSPAPARVPAVPTGVWCPAVTFFDPATDTLDLVCQEAYFAYLSCTGLAGLVVLGSNAETFLLTRPERESLVKCARKVVPPGFPLIAGVGGHSTAQVLEHISDAAAAGANYALLLPAAYFGKATTPSVIEGFFSDVATRSSLPIIIYNFPTICNGVDLDSEIIARLVRGNSNIVGVKLTCGSVAKIVRLAAEFEQERFVVFGGQSDFLIGGLESGSGGCIAAFANVFPRALVRIYDLWMEKDREGALELHKKAALAESPCKSGIAVTKYAAACFTAPLAGIQGAEEKLRPRRPYEPPSEGVKLLVRTKMQSMRVVEEGLSFRDRARK